MVRLYCKVDDLEAYCLRRAAVSPFRQRAMAGAFPGYLFNGYRRFMQQMPYWIIPFATGSSALAFFAY